MNKWIYAFLVVSAAAQFACAVDVVDEEEDGDARLGYLSFDSAGATSLTFNATSIQNAVILTLFLLVLGALILPLFAGGASTADSAEGYGYAGGNAYDQAAYEDPAATGYNGYAKRSLQMFAPIVNALAATRQKYEEE